MIFLGIAFSSPPKKSGGAKRYSVTGGGGPLFHIRFYLPASAPSSENHPKRIGIRERWAVVRGPASRCNNNRHTRTHETMPLPPFPFPLSPPYAGLHFFFLGYLCYSPPSLHNAPGYPRGGGGGPKTLLGCQRLANKIT